MKVNISGRGMIPGVGKLAPVYNHELDEKAIRRLLNFPAFRLHDSISGKLLTKNNVGDIITSHVFVDDVAKKAVTVVEPVIEVPVEPIPTVVETPVVAVEEPVVEDVVVETATEPINDDEEVVDAVVEETDETEETPDDDTASESTTDQPHPNYKKKNKKNRH